MPKERQARVVWNAEDVMKILPSVMNGMEEGLSLLKATRIAQKLLPLDRQRALTQEQNLPEVLTVAVSVAQLKGFKVEKVTVAPPPSDPFVMKCKKTGDENCPMDKVIPPHEIMGAWLTSVFAGALERATPALQLMLANAVNEGLGKHYMPKDPLAVAATKVVQPGSSMGKTGETGRPEPVKPKKVILIVGLLPPYRARLESLFAGYFGFKFWTPDSNTDELLKKAKESELCVADMATTSSGTVRMLRSTGYTVDEVRDGKSAQGFVDWCNAHKQRIEASEKSLQKAI